MSHEFKGKLVWADFYEVDGKLLNDSKALEQICRSAAEYSGMHVHAIKSYVFEPQGVDVFVSLLESSIVIHTYPEHNSCFVDIFTCGNADPFKILGRMIATIKPGGLDFGEINRGENRRRKRR